MTRHPVRQDNRPVVHYYPVPDPTAVELAPFADPTSRAVYRQHLVELAARRERDRMLYARWKQRRAAMAARDRRNRRIMLGIAAPLTLGVLGALGAAGWLLWHAMAGVNVLAVLVLIVLAVTAVGGIGHRCITVVQHWH